MLTIITTPRCRVIGLLSILVLLPAGCGRILGIEGAHVDPILDDESDFEGESDGADDSNDEADTVGLEPHNDETDTPPDASSDVDTSNDSDDTTAECVSFDNRRVPRLKPDGTLTPLPELDDAVR
jgi:hypothetical protein